MKKRIILLLIPAVLALCLLFVSSCSINVGDCLSPSESENVTEYNINERFTLVETIETSYAPGFHVYDKVNKQKYEIPTKPEYVTVDEIISENYIVFRSTGRNSESATVTVPKLIHCFNAGKDEFIYERIEEPLFFGLNEELSFGTDVEIEADLTVSIGLRDVDLLYELSEASLMRHGGGQIVPWTTIQYCEETDILIIKTDMMSSSSVRVMEENLSQNPYIEACVVIPHAGSGCFEIQLSLSEEVSGYYTGFIQGEDACLSISFE